MGWKKFEISKSRNVWVCVVTCELEFSEDDFVTGMEMREEQTSRRMDLSIINFLSLLHPPTTSALF